MASKRLKPVIIAVTKTNRKKQPYFYTIDKPGPASDETKDEYYTRSTTARTGALRQCKAVREGKDWFVEIKGRKHPVEFVSINKAKK